MSTLRVTNIQHPNAEDPAIELSPSGGALLSGLGDAPSGSTGAPWGLPFPVAGEAFGTQAIEDLAEATADGLSAAGGLVAVKHVLKTDTFTASVTAGNNVAVTGLSISHEVADPANRLIITAYFGTAGNSTGFSFTGLAVAQDGTLLGIGDAEGSRSRIGAGGRTNGSPNDRVSAPISLTFVHTPGAGEKIYTVRAVNMAQSAQTVFVNRNENDINREDMPRAASALVIQEVKV